MVTPVSAPVEEVWLQTRSPKPRQMAKTPSKAQHQPGRYGNFEPMRMLSSETHTNVIPAYRRSSEWRCGGLWGKLPVRNPAIISLGSRISQRVCLSILTGYNRPIGETGFAHAIAPC
jgi:hypothetical protein